MKKRSLIIAFLISVIFHLIIIVPLPFFSQIFESLSIIQRKKLAHKPDEPLSIEFIHQKPHEKENESAKRLSYETHIAKKETRTKELLKGTPQKSEVASLIKGDEEIKKAKEKPEERIESEENLERFLRGAGSLLDRNLPEEETVNLNTKEFKYISYFSKIKSKIELVWTYPQVSVIRGEQGTVHLKFTIVEDGNLEDVQLIKSSGYSALDEEAIRAVKMASPYPPLPKNWGLKKLHIIGEFNYILGYRIIR